MPVSAATPADECCHHFETECALVLIYSDQRLPSVVHVCLSGYLYNPEIFGCTVTYAGGGGGGVNSVVIARSPSAGTEDTTTDK